MTIAAWLLAAAVHAPIAPPPEVDAYVRARMSEQKIPGLALAVVRDGRIEIAAGFGLADVEHQVPVKPETVFQSGSTGKQFAAAAALLLADEGKLALDDPVSKYVPAPTAWKGITVRHLLTHTSGIPEYTDSIDLRRDYTEAQLVEMAGQRPLDFPPGTKWSYSNTAYAVLGAVIRKASGKFYGDVLEERIFAPLGMETARVISEEDIVPDRAAGYRLDDGVLKNQSWVAPLLNTTADGALYVSALDMAKWARALDADHPLRAALREQMWTPARLSDGRAADARGSGYGLGWFVGRHKDHHPLIEHGGSWQGFQAWIGRFPAQRMSVIALSNLAGSNPGLVGRGVAEILAPELAR